MVLKTDIAFGMDLVPVYEFDGDKQFWLSDRAYPGFKEKQYQNWHAVPKPPKYHVNKSNTSFITSYAPIERGIMNNLKFFKMLIRIFKKMRDTQDKSMRNLKSFYIQTVFMLYLVELNSTNDSLAFNGRIDVLFLTVSIYIIVQ